MTLTLGVSPSVLFKMAEDKHNISDSNKSSMTFDLFSCSSFNNISDEDDNGIFIMPSNLQESDSSDEDAQYLSDLLGVMVAA